VIGSVVMERRMLMFDDLLVGHFLGRALSFCVKKARTLQLVGAAMIVPMFRQ